jgi:hypothetical protein
MACLGMQLPFADADLVAYSSVQVIERGRRWRDHWFVRGE